MNNLVTSCSSVCAYDVMFSVSYLRRRFLQVLTDSYMGDSDILGKLAVSILAKVVA